MKYELQKAGLCLGIGLALAVLVTIVIGTFAFVANDGEINTVGVYWGLFSGTPLFAMMVYTIIPKRVKFKTIDAETLNYNFVDPNLLQGYKAWTDEEPTEWR